MTGRLIVVSNRIPTGGSPSGGLVVALHDALARQGGLWIGAHPEPGPEKGFFELETGPYRRLAFRLSQTEVSDYYLGFANSVLWPLFHRRGDLVNLNSAYETAYLGLNARLARMLSAILQPDDLLWVHDYHLIPLALELRRLGVTNRIGFFLHIPFPALGDLAILPDPSAFAEWLAAYNLVGLQTRSDTARCLEMFRANPKAEMVRNGAIRFGERLVNIRSFPIGIDVDGFREMAEAGDRRPFEREEPGRFVLGVDRLDYTKGLPNRLRAFGRYLDAHADGEQPCLIQIAPSTREKVDAYRQITAELEEISGRVNGRHAEIDWTPIRYINRAVDRGRLALLYRRAVACLVTSYADGMNLVAKEFVAAQDPADPGVLILSRLAGAAEDLTEALLVNPHDIGAMAEAIHRAVNMPLEERRYRHDECLRAVKATDVSIWCGAFLKSLRACPVETEWTIQTRLAPKEAALSDFLRSLGAAFPV
jgi:trehalose 6-phosphate synthase